MPAFAPLHLFPLAFISLAWLFHTWSKASSPRQAAIHGFLWSLGCFLTGISWIYISMHNVGGMPAPMAAAMTLLFSSYLALYPALAGYVFVRLRSSAAWRNALLFAGLWFINEWLRGTVFTGFPWLAIGYSQTAPSPLAGYAPLIGSYGIGFLLALIAALLVACCHRVRGARLCLIPVVVLFAAGPLLRQIEWTTPHGAPLRVSLLQGNVEQTIKWNPEHLFYSMETYARLARENPADLTVFPETTIPLMLDQVPKEYLRQLTQHGTILLGAAVRERHANGVEDGYNAAVALDSTLRPDYYFKSHLVPFGEFIPPGFSWFFKWVNIPLADFARGPKQQPALSLLGQQIAPNICYEDLFGEEIINALPQATLLINVSNTAWFGDSLAQPQHLQIAQMRAMETGRMMLRSTNTGMTAAVAANGDIIATLPPFTRGGLSVMAQGYTGATPYVGYGNTLAMLIALLALLPSAIPFVKSRRNKETS